LNDQQNAVRLRLSRFLYAPPAYKSKLLTQMCHTKNASPKAMHFADNQVIRLGSKNYDRFREVILNSRKNILS